MKAFGVQYIYIYNIIAVYFSWWTLRTEGQSKSGGSITTEKNQNRKKVQM